MIVDNIALFDQTATDAFPLLEVRSCVPSLKISHLPNEVKNNIILFCDFKSLLKLRLVNKELNQLITKNMLIEKFCQESEYYKPETFSFENYNNMLQNIILNIFPDQSNKINNYISQVNEVNNRQFSKYLFFQLYEAMIKTKKIYFSRKSIKRYSFPEGVRGDINNVALSGCGNYLFALVNRKKITQWRFNIPQDFIYITEFYHNDDMPNIKIIRFSNYTNDFITMTDCGDLKIWHVDESTVPRVKHHLPNLDQVNQSDILSVLLCSNNNWLFVRYNGDLIKVWKKQSTNNYIEYLDINNNKSLSVSRDSKMLVELHTCGMLTFYEQETAKNFWVATSSIQLIINNSVFISIAINNKDGICILNDGYKNIIILQRIKNNYNWQLSKKIKLQEADIFLSFLCYQSKFIVLQKRKYLHDDAIVSLFSIEKKRTFFNKHNISISLNAKVYVDVLTSCALPHPNGFSVICFINNENKNIDVISFNKNAPCFYKKKAKYLIIPICILILYFIFFFNV